MNIVQFTFESGDFLLFVRCVVTGTSSGNIAVVFIVLTFQRECVVRPVPRYWQYSLGVRSGCSLTYFIASSSNY